MILWSMREDQTQVLGPGMRSVLWVSGCCFNCAGCVANHARNGASTADTPKDLADWFLRQGQSGLTLSGGEPFLQAGELSEMIALIRQSKPDVSVIVYSGFQIKELYAMARAGREDIAALLTAADVIIDGRYEAEHDDGRYAVGSANQNVIRLSQRLGQSVLDAYYTTDRARSVEIKVNPDGVKLVGVPDKTQYQLWQMLKGA